MERLNLSSSGVFLVWVPLCIFQTIFSAPCTTSSERQERKIYFETKTGFGLCEAYFSLLIAAVAGAAWAGNREIKGLVHLPECGMELDLYSPWPLTAGAMRQSRGQRGGQHSWTRIIMCISCDPSICASLTEGAQKLVIMNNTAPK